MTAQLYPSTPQKVASAVLSQYGIKEKIMSHFQLDAEGIVVNYVVFDGEPNIPGNFVSAQEVSLDIGFYYNKETGEFVDPFDMNNDPEDPMVKKLRDRYILEHEGFVFESLTNEPLTLSDEELAEMISGLE
jgi:hypothetical protein